MNARPCDWAGCEKPATVSVFSEYFGLEQCLCAEHAERALATPFWSESW